MTTLEENGTYNPRSPKSVKIEVISEPTRLSGYRCPRCRHGFACGETVRAITHRGLGGTSYTHLQCETRPNEQIPAFCWPTIKKYVTAYPHLAALADRCETDTASRKTLGDQIGRLAVPPTVSGTELLEISKLGIR